MGMSKSAPLQENNEDSSAVETNAKDMLSIKEIQVKVSEMLDEVIEHEGTAKQSKLRNHKAKSKCEESWLKALEFVYSQHLYYAETAIGDDSWEYREPMKSAVAALTPASKKNVTSNPMLGLVKCCFHGCTAKKSQKEWTRNNKTANVLYYAHKMHWADIQGGLFKVGGRDKAAALGAKLRKGEIQAEVKPTDKDEACKKHIEDFIAESPTILANQLTASTDAVLDGLTLAFVRKTTVNEASIIPVPASCVAAANRVIAKILKKEAANEKAS